FSMVLRKDFPALGVERAHVVLVEMTDRLLPPFSPSSAAHAAKTLRERGVEVITGEAVARVTSTRVTLRSGREINAHTLIWAAGVQANPLAAVLGFETARAGRIVVSPDLRITAHGNAFAVGDIAAIRDRATESFLPMLAPVAMQSGKHAAHEITRAIEGHSPQPFRYRDKGTMAT